MDLRKFVQNNLCREKPNIETCPEFIIATVKKARVNAFAFMEVTTYFLTLALKVFAFAESDSNTP